MEMRIDEQGKSWSGWEGNFKEGSKTPLRYKLTDLDVRALPQSIVNKYNLQGYENLRMSPYNGEIYIVSNTGGHLKTINQKDMKWFQNPGRLSGIYKDPRFNHKHDNALDYLNNYDFEYWQDSQPLDPLEVKTIQELEVEVDNNLPTRNVQEITDLSDLDIAELEIEEEEEIVSLEPREITNIPEDNPGEDDLTLLPQVLNENVIDSSDDLNTDPLDEDNNNEINTEDGTKERVVPKPGPGDQDDIEVNMPEIVLTPEMQEKRNKKRTKEEVLADLKNTTGNDRKALYDELGWAYDDTIPNHDKENKTNTNNVNTNNTSNDSNETNPNLSIDDLKSDLKNVKGTNKYVNQSVDAILNAVQRDDYNEKDLNRDLDLFKNHYGDENLQLLQLMLENNKEPKARRGVELRKFQQAGEKNPGWLAKRLAKTVNPIGYDIGNAISGLISGERQPFMWNGVEQTFDNFGYDIQGNPIMDPDVEGRFKYGDTEEKHREHTDYIKASSMDSWLKYLGFPQENETFIKSQFIPTIRSEDKEGKNNYWSFQYDDDIWDEAMSFMAPVEGSKTGISIFDDKFDQLHPYGASVSNSSAGGFTLKDYTLSKGFDQEVGLPYISYSDEFDFDIPIMGTTIPGEQIIGQPYDVYGRMYYDPNIKDKNGNPTRIFSNEFDNLGVNLNSLKAGVMSTESSNGINMQNENSSSSATGLYGQLFSQLIDNDLYTGTRDEFKNDIEAQNEIFDLKFEGNLFENEKGLEESAKDLYFEYRDQIDMPFNQTEIAALVNFIGRQGTREFLGYVLRDGEPLEDVFPDLYGDNAKVKNKTPFEYIDQFREGVEEYEKYQNFENYILNNLPAEITNQFLRKYSKEELIKKQEGGELEGQASRKWSRILSELNKYDNGKNISEVSKNVLLEYDLIDVEEEEIITPEVTNTPIKKIVEEFENDNSISIENRKFNLNEQVKLYDRYLNGYFSDQEETALTKVIDKINRVYYNDSKSNNVHVYDYIRSLQTNE
jgi:hypothetical protein